MSDLACAILQNFASAVDGEPHIFVTHSLHADRLVMRELFYAAEDEVFVLARTFPAEIISPPVVRNVVSRKSPPRISVLLTGVTADCDFSALSCIFNFLNARDTIELRSVEDVSPVTVTVVDCKHLRIECVPEGALVALNTLDNGRAAMARLRRMWSAARPFDLTAI